MKKTNSKKFYVTTPIYYVTSRPHVGSLYTTVLADVVARWNKLLGKKTFFLTGTDEHGQKVSQEAEKAGKAPQEFVDSFIESYQKTWRQYDLQYNYFIRTTDPLHIKVVQEWLQSLQKKEDIYKNFYEGWYCVSDEAFVKEKELGETRGPVCTQCGRPTTLMSEECYFFKLSKYQNKLLKFYEENPDFITPKERMHEVINFVKSGLKDLSISRTTISWGIPFPNDEKHVVYVWADALNNYISAIGYGQPDKQDEFNFWWPADLHIMGKEILRFHAVYWPAFLMGSDLALPKKLLVHGWITVDGQKMSKSLGNVVDPIVLLEKYGAEPVKYYLARQIAVNQDGDFSYKDLEQRISSDLANDLGNLLNRMVSLAEKHEVGAIEPFKHWSSQSKVLKDESEQMIKEFQTYMGEYQFHMALARLWKFINQVNAYFHGQEPWKLAKENRDNFLEVLSATSHSLCIIAILAWPVMPRKMEQMLLSLGITMTVDDNNVQALKGSWTNSFAFQKVPNLFVKYDLKEVKANLQIKKTKVQLGSVEISIDDFSKVQMIVGTIESAEDVEKSDNLIKMKVDFGILGRRQICAGIKKFYKSQDLIGKQGVFVFNLQSRKLMGVESHGMMLCAEDSEKKPQIVTLMNFVPNGTRLK